MSKEITLQDCEDLYKRFEKYTETAEQHVFPRLLMVHMMMNRTMSRLRMTGKVEDQKDARAMFRVVLATIGADNSEYEEVKNV
jgi:hypothetical protein